MEEIKRQLLELRNKDKFLIDDWSERGLNPSNPEIVEGMNIEVNKFIGFVLSNLERGSVSRKDLTANIQKYVDEADFWDDYDTEEKEWIYDEFCSVIEKVGVNQNDLLI